MADKADLPSGTVTFLFTDIEGSTKLLRRLGEDYARVLGEHQALLRAAFSAHGGVEVDTEGDSFFVAFHAAPQAVAAAAAATRALAEHPWPEGTTLRVRMGLHTGTPQLVSDQYVGIDVHRAARIAAAGHGGQVLLSQTTRELVEQALPPDVTLRDLGAHRLKDLGQPERLSQLVIAGFPADFPPLKTLDQHQHNLPVQPTPLLGRAEELTALAALLRREDVRVVSLTGPGGIGKTRLSIQVAAEVVSDFADGVWCVRLSRLSDPALVVPTIAQTLSLHEAGSQPIAEVLRAHLATKHLLLVLDNFEQVVGAATDLANLLEASPGLKLLVTSRLPLRLRGERAYPLVPLPLPDMGHLPEPAQLSHYAAVALFVERAQAAKPDFAVTASNAPAIAAICAHLDGLPLAIELAAARVRTLPPEALLARLTAQLNVLTGGARDLEERQQTMRAAIAWSDALLTPAEQALFRRLAVFVGGCTLEAAEAVCAAPRDVPPLAMDLLDGLSALVDHSLIQQREEGGEALFGMLHVIREYALEHLEAAGEAEALRHAHAEYFLAMAERAQPRLAGPNAGEWFDRLEREHDNLRAALDWLRARGDVESGLRLAIALARFWDTRGYLREGRGWVEVLLALGSDPASADDGGTPAIAPRMRAEALQAVGHLALWQADFAVAERRLEEAVALGRSIGHGSVVAFSLNDLGTVAGEDGDLERSAARYTESLALMREIGDQHGIARVLNNLGVVALDRHDLERAAAWFRESLTLYRQFGDHLLTAIALLNLGNVARLRGDLAGSETLLREALLAAKDRGEVRVTVNTIEEYACTLGAAGQGERAARLLGAAAALHEAHGMPLQPQWRRDMEQAIAPVRAALGEAAWVAAFAAGRALSPDEAIAEALGNDR